MSYMVAASTGFAAARAIYEAGNKSSNKLHLPAGSPYAAGPGLHFDDTMDAVDPSHEDRFNSACVQLGGFRGRFRIPQDHFLKDGKAMLRMRPVAANCGELAMMAAAGAWMRLGEPQAAPIALFSLKAPADHVFCVVGPRVRSRALGNASITNLATSPNTEGMWAADPWLNVLCRLKDYPARAAAKFNKWQADNKRVAWGAGPLGPGWYAPAGHYAAGFAAADLEVILG